jgi:hypothetical protein
VNVRPVAFVLLALPCAWLALLVVPNLTHASLPVVLVPFVVCVGLATYSAVRTQYPDLLVSAVVGAIGLLAVGTASSGAFGWEVGLGLVLGLPWVLAGYIARTDTALGLRFLGFGGSVALGLCVLATRADLGVRSGSLSAQTLLRGVYVVMGDQGQVFGGLLNGTAIPSLPLLDFFDPVFAGLTGAAVLGLCLAAVRPRTGPGVLLPLSIPLHRVQGEGSELPAAYGFTPRQRAVFAERTVAEPPLTAWPPGLGAILCGAIGASLFLVVAYVYPFQAVLVLTLALVGVSVATMVLAQFPGILRLPTRTRRRSRSLLLSAQTPRVTKELLTSPSLPVNEAPPPPPSAEG